MDLARPYAVAFPFEQLSKLCKTTTGPVFLWPSKTQIFELTDCCMSCYKLSSFSIGLYNKMATEGEKNIFLKEIRGKRKVKYECCDSKFAAEAKRSSFFLATG